MNQYHTEGRLSEDSEEINFDDIANFFPYLKNLD